MKRKTRGPHNIGRTIDEHLQDEANRAIDCGRSGKPLSPLRPKWTLEEVTKFVSEFKDEELIEITITFTEGLRTQWHEITLAGITEKVVGRSLFSGRAAVPTARLALIGEYSPTGLWHYHGLIQGVPGDKLAKLKRACSRHLGRTEIKFVAYPASYKTYTLKSYNTDYLPQKWNNYTTILFS